MTGFSDECPQHQWKRWSLSASFRKPYLCGWVFKKTSPQKFHWYANLWAYLYLILFFVGIAMCFRNSPIKNYTIQRCVDIPMMPVLHTSRLIGSFEETLVRVDWRRAEWQLFPGFSTFFVFDIFPSGPNFLHFYIVDTQNSPARWKAACMQLPALVT